MNEERMNWIDITRGISVLLVVFSHLESKCYIFSIWYHCFFVSLFFFISGVLYKERVL